MRLFILVPFLIPDARDLFVCANDPKEAARFYLDQSVRDCAKASVIVGVEEIKSRLGVVKPKRLDAEILPVADKISTCLTALGARRSDSNFWVYDEPYFTSDGMSDSEFLEKIFALQFNARISL